MGFELIAKAFGSDLKQMAKNKKCEMPISILVDDPVFAGIDKISAYENHQWKVNDISDVLITLARSQDGIEVIRHKTRPIYGFQFHPEESNYDDCGIKLFENIFTLTRIN